MERVIQVEIKFTNATLAVVIGLLLAGALFALLWTTGVVVAAPASKRATRPLASPASALVGEKVNYQGRIEGASGPITMTFRLWEDEASTDAGDMIWEESKIVTPTGGLFNTQLGDATHLNQDDIYGQELWLVCPWAATMKWCPARKIHEEKLNRGTINITLRIAIASPRLTSFGWPRKGSIRSRAGLLRRWRTTQGTASL